MAEDRMSIVPYGPNLDVVLYVSFLRLLVLFRSDGLLLAAATMTPSSVSIGTPRSWFSGTQLAKTMASTTTSS